MTQLIQITDQVFAIEVPEGLQSPWFQTEQSMTAIVEGRSDNDELVIRHIERKCGSPTGKIIIDLPPSNWQLICTTKECTEEIAKKIVGSSEWYFPVRHTRYIDYTKPYDRENKQRWSEGFGSALGSIVSLFESNNLDANKNYVLIKKVS